MAELELPTREQEFADTIKDAREQGLLPSEDGEAEPKKEPLKAEVPKGRDESGKFVKQDKAEKVEAEPFAGFNDLPEEAKAQWNTFLGRTKNLESELTQLRRQNAALMGRVPALQSEVARLQKSGHQPASQTKAADLKAQLKRFEAYKERYPEDAEAIDEYISAATQQLAQTNTQLADKLSQLERRLGTFEGERTVQENRSVQDQLDREHPSWRIIAGWQDADGNAVDPNRADFHPHFKAWKAALPPELQVDFDQKLKSRSAHLIGHVLDAFERDYQVAVDASGRGAETASDADPVRSRRAEALRDVSPTGSASSSVPVDKPIQSPRMSREEEYAATVAMFKGDPRFAHWN